jgi:hypothetical protein
MQDAYFIQKGVIQFRPIDYQKLPQKYASYIFIILNEWDQIQADKQKEASKGKDRIGF